MSSNHEQSTNHNHVKGVCEEDEGESDTTPINSENNPSYGSTESDVDSEENLKSVTVICDDEKPFSKKLPFREEQFGFDFTFVKRFYRLNGLLFMHFISAATGMFLFLVCMVLLKEYIVYQVGLIANFMEIYRRYSYRVYSGEKDLKGFWIQTAKSVGLIIAVSFVNSTTQYVQKLITVIYRKTLTQACHRVYFADIRYYQLNALDKAIDNPDQRMTQDINKFCTTYCNTLPKLLVSPFTIGYYCYQGYLRSGWQGPVGCFCFFIVATVINKLLMTPIVNYVVKQEKCEGDFRFLHMLVRVHSESIAFHEAAIVEHGKVDDALGKLVDTQYSLYLREYFLSFSVNLGEYIGSIFSYLMLAIPIFSGQHDDLSPADLSLLISQNAFILIYLIFTFTNLIGISGEFADVAGVTHRIAQLIERINAIDEHWGNPDSKSGQNQRKCENLNEWTKCRQNIQKRISGGIVTPPNNPQQKLPIWKLTNMSLSPPLRKEWLISKLNMEFIVGESVLITGPSSAGKTSLFRCLKGLWPCSEGTLESYFPPGPHGVYICPQRAYLTWGTIREQISFPLKPDRNQLDDQLILHYMDKLKLMPIVERVGGLDVPCSWSVFDSLSPGEMQRICVLRIFYHQPVVAVLDEVTSALPMDTEEYIYMEMRRLGITLISVGHRESIRRYHDKNLKIGSDGKWKVSPISQELQQ